METDRYAGFADRYDLFSGEFKEHNGAVTEFFRTLFEQHGVHSVLDCACGTGKDLHLFHSLGMEVCGSDISEAMLAQARKNLAGDNIEVPLLKADYRELPDTYHRQFDAVVCLATAIAEMPDDAEVLRAFNSMYGVLRDGGILVLTQGTGDRQWARKPRFIPALNNRDFSRIFVIDYLEKGACYNILDVFHDEKTVDFKVWSIEYLNILLRDDQERLLRKNGFKQIDYYGNYHFEPYDKQTSDRIITVAMR